MPLSDGKRYVAVLVSAGCNDAELLENLVLVLLFGEGNAGQKNGGKGKMPPKGEVTRKQTKCRELSPQVRTNSNDTWLGFVANLQRQTGKRANHLSSVY